MTHTCISTLLNTKQSFFYNFTEFRDIFIWFVNVGKMNQPLDLRKKFSKNRRQIMKSQNCI